MLFLTWVRIAFGLANSKPTCVSFCHSNAVFSLVSEFSNVPIVLLSVLLCFSGFRTSKLVQINFSVMFGIATAGWFFCLLPSK